MQRQKKYLVLLHILFWPLVTIIDTFFYSKLTLANYFTTNALLFLLFYGNYFFLTKLIINKQEGISYAIWLVLFFAIFIGVFVGWVLIRIYFLHHNFTWTTSMFTLYSIYLAIFYGSVSTGLRLTWNLFDNLEKQRVLLLQKTQKQIQLMKTNINLPFMLQTLTHLEKTARVNPEAIEHNIISLSNVLRYGLYESQCESIELEKELEILTDFISLLNETRNGVNINLQSSIHETDIQIPPNLLVKFTALWADVIGQSLLSSQPVQLKVEGLKGVKYYLPVFSKGEQLMTAVHDKLPNFENTLFDVSYSVEGDLICLSIG